MLNWFQMLSCRVDSGEPVYPAKGVLLKTSRSSQPTHLWQIQKVVWWMKDWLNLSSNVIKRLGSALLHTDLWSSGWCQWTDDCLSPTTVETVGLEKQASSSLPTSCQPLAHHSLLVVCCTTTILLSKLKEQDCGCHLKHCSSFKSETRFYSWPVWTKWCHSVSVCWAWNKTSSRKSRSEKWSIVQSSFCFNHNRLLFGRTPRQTVVKRDSVLSSE